MPSEFDKIIEDAIRAIERVPEDWPIREPRVLNDPWAESDARLRQPAPQRDATDEVDEAWSRIKDLPGLDVDELVFAITEESDFDFLPPARRLEALARTQSAQSMALAGEYDSMVESLGGNVDLWQSVIEGVDEQTATETLSWLQQQADAANAERQAQVFGEAEQFTRENPAVAGDPRFQRLLATALESVQVGLEDGDARDLMERTKSAHQEIDRADRVNAALDHIFAEVDGRDRDGNDWLGNPMPETKRAEPDIRGAVERTPAPRKVRMEAFDRAFEEATTGGEVAEEWHRMERAAVEREKQIKRERLARELGEEID